MKKNFKKNDSWLSKLGLKLHCGLKMQKGSTIIELLIAVMVVGLITTAIANAVTYSIKNTGESRFRQVATTLGQQVIEDFRSQKNELGIINFSNTLTAGNNCYSDLDNPVVGSCGDSAVISMAGADFKRDVLIGLGGSGTRIPDDPYYITITVTVSWNDGTSTRDIELIQDFKQSSGFTN